MQLQKIQDFSIKRAEHALKVPEIQQQYPKIDLKSTRTSRSHLDSPNESNVTTPRGKSINNIPHLQGAHHISTMQSPFQNTNISLPPVNMQMFHSPSSTTLKSNFGMSSSGLFQPRGPAIGIEEPKLYQSQIAPHYPMNSGTPMKDSFLQNGRMSLVQSPHPLGMAFTPKLGGNLFQMGRYPESEEMKMAKIIERQTNILDSISRGLGDDQEQFLAKKQAFLERKLQKAENRLFEQELNISKSMHSNRSRKESKIFLYKIK